MYLGEALLVVAITFQVCRSLFWQVAMTMKSVCVLRDLVCSGILSVVKAGYRFTGAAAPCSGVQGMYKLHAAAFAQSFYCQPYKM